ncbi:MGH1-like glycoside hydrolase domain-containing protein [Maribacter sp. 2210JD10-5]|uniref:MGH1-like glycoside hydrolase domain-containing protein n=1 Tax=Maribacter sp. 2210JD10-5 TaxID=3386272 RepID=UPI0039BD579F
MSISLTLDKLKKSLDIDLDTLRSRINFDNRNIRDKGILYFTEADADLLTGYSYGEFYDWDLYFENIYLSYFGVDEYCFTNLKAFLARQHQNGFVSRTLIEPRPYQHFKPFLAQLALLGSKQRGFEWLSEEVIAARNKGPAEDGIMDEETYQDGGTFYERLKKYLHHWFWHLDFDKNGLPVWNSCDHSGMDNQFSRSGTFNAFRYEGVDLACYLHRELRAMEVLAVNLDFKKDAADYQAQAKTLAKNINTYFWDDSDGFYYDRDEHTGHHVKVKSVAGFLPLYAGVAPKERAERLIKEHLLNPEEFWTTFPIPAYAKSEPDYDQTASDHGCNWRGTTWIPANYMVFYGLLDYGYTDIAKQLAQKTFEMVFHKNGATREYFNGETGEGYGLNPFWGWSTLAYFMPLELELEYYPMAINNSEIKHLGKDVFGVEFPS